MDFRPRSPPSGLTAPRLLTTISGFNLNGGKRLEISVFVSCELRPQR
jgi:hypothetical protein